MVVVKDLFSHELDDIVEPAPEAEPESDTDSDTDSDEDDGIGAFKGCGSVTFD